MSGVTGEKLDDILRANGFLKKGSVFDPGKVQGFAIDTYESCINNVAHLLEYVLNNGTGDKTISKTLKSSVKTAGDILKLKSTDSSGGKFASIKNAVKDQVSKCPGPDAITGLEISGYAVECAKSCMEGIDVFSKEIEDADEEGYKKIQRGYLKNLFFKPYAEWKAKANGILIDSKKKLEELCAELDGVVDNSSSVAMGYCSDIIGRLARWRHVTVHCYLIFLDTMADDLDKAIEAAKTWSERNVGVSKKAPKATESDLKGLAKWQTDQFSDYIVASKK